MKYIYAIIFWLTLTEFSSAATSVTQHGITWTFDKDYPTGQFVTGDYYVVDSGDGVVITGISNSRHSELDLSTVDYDGSMVDIHRPLNTQGFDSRGPYYSASRNINKSLPYNIISGKSLLSSISWRPEDTDDPSGASIGRPWLKRVAILTVVNSAPAEGMFRPSYAVGQKAMYSSVGVDVASMPTYAPVISTPPIETIASYVSSPWLDAIDNYQSEFFRPSDNYPYAGTGKNGTYGRYLAAASGVAALATTLDQDEVGDKSGIVLGLIQIGIDAYGMLLNGAKWAANGGHHAGFRLPIVFAGEMLNHSGMLGISSYPLNTFQEDNHFYVGEIDITTINCGDKNGCPAPCGDAGIMVTDVENRQYTSEHLGMAEWGIRHHEDRCRDDLRISALYRDINFGSLGGHALAIRMLGFGESWGNNAFMDYHDRIFGSTNASIDTAFATEMWNTYRQTLTTTPEPPFAKITTFSTAGQSRFTQTGQVRFTQ